MGWLSNHWKRVKSVRFKGKCSSCPGWLPFEKSPSFFHMLPGAVLEGACVGMGVLCTKHTAPAAAFCGCLLLAIQTRNWGRIPSGKNPKQIVLPRWAGSAAHRASCSCPSQHSLPDVLLALPKEPRQVQRHGCLHLFLLAVGVLPLTEASIAITSVHYLFFLQTNVCNCAGVTLTI